VTYVVAGAAGLAAMALFLLTIRRPLFGCAALVLTVPLTAGLSRGSVIPVLKPNELILLIVLAGVIAHLVTIKRIRPVGGLDLAVGGYVLGSIAIPWMVLTLSHYPADLDTWRTVLSPALFLVVYYVFSRTTFSEDGVRAVLNSAMLAGVLVCLIAAAELVNLPGARSFIEAYYPAPILSSFRPSSTLGHYSAVGAFGALTYILALAIATVGHPGFSTRWLTFVMGTGLLGVIVSQTWAPLAVLPLATLIIVLYGRRIPRELAITAVLGIIGLIVLFPLISARFDSQHLISAQGFAIPESMQTRVRYWSEFIIPALSEHIWVGTGTVIPGTVPAPLATFVDNEYLWAAFRAGIPGVALLLGMLLSIMAVAVKIRTSKNPSQRAIGAAALATITMLLLLGATAQYITFAGLSQEIAMVVGVLAGMTTHVYARRAPFVVISSEPRWIAMPGRVEAALVELRKYKPEPGLVRSSAVVFAGFATARALGFLFSVAAARILVPLDYGRLTYALAVVSIASVFISGAPIGLSRFLARNQGDRAAQEAYFANWTTMVAFIVIGSALVVAPISYLIGLRDWLLVGVLCNLAGIAVLEMYREVQRGLDRYAAMMSVYVIANLMQLLGIVVLGLLGVHSPSLFLIVYGLSSAVALALVQPLMPIKLHFARALVSARRIMEIFRFARPLLVQSVFFAIWFGSDLIMVQHFMNPRAVANYGVAKALVNVLMLAPTAIGTAILPRIARLGEKSIAKYMLAALGLTALATIPLVSGAAALGPRLIAIVFSGKYPDAAAPLAILAIGMGLYGFYTVMGSIWVGLGRPTIDPIATGIAMTCTLAVGIALITPMGLRGAALAFTVGAAARLTVIGVFTLWAFSTRRLRHLEPPATDARGLQPQT
jgi:O-antigen/teichoic acid export membrane protein